MGEKITKFKYGTLNVVLIILLIIIFIAIIPIAIELGYNFTNDGVMPDTRMPDFMKSPEWIKYQNLLTIVALIGGFITTFLLWREVSVARSVATFYEQGESKREEDIKKRQKNPNLKDLKDSDFNLTGFSEQGHQYLLEQTDSDSE